jgi:lysophospholipase L1-like esterase
MICYIITRNKSEEKNNFTYLDYHSHMLDNQGYLGYDLVDDYLHPNEKGYEVMAPLVQKAIDENLG